MALLLWGFGLTDSVLWAVSLMQAEACILAPANSLRDGEPLR